MLKNNERLDDLQINNKFVIQNKDEYCFTSDAVQLANFAKVKPNDKVVDLCSGSGVVGILIQTKTTISLQAVWYFREACGSRESIPIQFPPNQALLKSSESTAGTGAEMHGAKALQRIICIWHISADEM